MNNVINRNATIGKPIAARKVIGVEKANYGDTTTTTTEAQVDNSTSEATISTETQTTDKPAEEVQAEKSPEDKRSEKRNEFSALEKARKLEADAKDKLRKAQELSDAYASKDLDRIAKANGMSTSDYVRWINAKAIGAPTEKALSPAEQVALNAKQWQEKMESEMKEVRNVQAATNKDSYINKNILPHLIKNPDEYEFIHDRGVDETAALIYDFMNQHYVETGGRNGGEELDPVELLNSLEDQYMNEWKERQEKAKKFKKLNSQPSSDPTKTGVKTIGPGKSVPAPGLSEADILADLNGGQIDDNALAKTAPSNLVGGASRGNASAQSNGASVKGTMQTGGTTPKGSKFSREARLAAMAKSRTSE